MKISKELDFIPNFCQICQREGIVTYIGHTYPNNKKSNPKNEKLPQGHSCSFELELYLNCSNCGDMVCKSRLWIDSPIVKKCNDATN